MNLDEIKLKRLTEGKKSIKKGTGLKKIQTLPNGAQVYANEEQTPDHAASVVSEGEQKHHTPKFVQHCVAAITADPGKLSEIEKRKDGSPFGICNAQYNKNKPALAAKHSQGPHHTMKDYEKALVKLREAVEQRAAQNVRPASIIFSPDSERETPKTVSVRYVPGA